MKKEQRKYMLNYEIMDIKGKQNNGGVCIIPCPFNLSLIGVINHQDTKVGDKQCVHCDYFNIMNKYKNGVIVHCNFDPTLFNNKNI
jgi:hypothetical protein